MTINLKENTTETDELIALLSDIDGQPPWRSNANKACAYYDGDQLSPNVIEILRERGQPETMHNLIAPAIDGVLGMEAKTRTDLMVTADDYDEDIEELAQAINEEFADLCRLGRLDRARAEAYKGQVICGVGFVEVFRNTDPFGPKYKILNIARDEVHWDWFSKEPDWSDCHWVMRSRWVDIDTLIQSMPEKADILRHAVNHWEGFVDTTIVDGAESNLVNAWEEYQSWSRDHSEYLSNNRKRIKLQIVYRRHYNAVTVMCLGDGRVVEYDKHNLRHATAVAMGRVKLKTGQTSHITETWFAGPYRLEQRPCQAPRGMYPIVPFYGYRKDKSGEPYGLSSRAIPAQDEVNFRRIKLTWLLQAKLVIADKDATKMSRERLLEEVERPDGYVELNPDRKNRKSISDAIEIRQDFNVASQQFQVMQDSMKLVQDTMGIYSAFLGQEGAADSGVAIANLVEQGATTLAELNDNYRLACLLVGELLLGFILEDMKGERNKKITINREDRTKRRNVILNEETEDAALLNNDVTRLRAHISLAPIQQTSAFKAQMAERMSNATAHLPPQAQMAVFDLVAELMDIPNKSEFLERIRGAMNVPKDPEDMSPEEQQAHQADQEKARMQEELAFREMKARVEELEGKVAHLNAETDSKQYDNAKKQAETGETLAKMQKLTEELNVMRQQYEQFLSTQIEALQL
ncbi:portal protein [Grimontia marina]|uniref:Portal protein n=1 Tax=Grimontia marina TaxID=646534 RepID=A0A128EYR8_9GAMM|nr:hypothetical protein [Grimontia marina]CZF79713.1 hypothetical protein GMA8713_01098 [Grimontia marina]